MCKRVSSTLLQTQSDCPVKHDNAVDIDPRNMVSIIIYYRIKIYYSLFIWSELKTGFHIYNTNNLRICYPLKPF